MPNRYCDTNGEPCLERSVIVVADILGYSASTHKAFEDNKEQAHLKRIHTALDKAKKNVRDPSDSLWYPKLFSDNIVLGYRFIEPGEGSFEFPQACHSIGHFQRELAVDGFFIRGGIAVGQIHMSENLIYGKIIEELQQAEKRALYPRIVLLDSAVEHLKTKSEDHRRTLRDILWSDDCDSTWFVNYLYPLGGRGSDSYRSGLLKHKEHIESGLANYETNRGVVEKYRWLAAYHNRFCRSSRYWCSASYCIEE